MEDGTLGVEKQSGQNKDLMTETIRKKLVSRTASNQAEVGPLSSYLKVKKVSSSQGVTELMRKGRK